MSGTILDLLITLVAGMIGGNGIGKSLPEYDLGPVGNTIAGAIGGVIAGLGLHVLLPFLAGRGSIQQIAALLIGGVVAGAILTVVVSKLTSRMAND